MEMKEDGVVRKFGPQLKVHFFMGLKLVDLKQKELEGCCLCLA